MIRKSTSPSGRAQPEPPGPSGSRDGSRVTVRVALVNPALPMPGDVRLMNAVAFVIFGIGGLLRFRTDVGESKDLSGSMPDKVRELQARWEKWSATLAKPKWTDPRIDGTNAKTSAAAGDK